MMMIGGRGVVIEVALPLSDKVLVAYGEGFTKFQSYSRLFNNYVGGGKVVKSWVI